MMFLTPYEMCYLLNRRQKTRYGSRNFTDPELKLFQIDDPEVINRGALCRMILEGQIPNLSRFEQ